LQIKKKTTADYEIPVEFQNRLNKNRALRTAWDGLTPGRQRGYIFYFSQPKLPATREARIEKYTKQILNGKGIDD
jgi:uncharacterized protein YdeI (YjbR/CyaY-like superfamily)